jgi:dimethylargininase
MPFATPAKVLVRAVSPRYADCVRADASVPIDTALARAQHAGYVDALRKLGVAVELIDADGACADCCFIEDTAVVVGAARAVATHPGAPSRRAEVAPVAAALARTCEVTTMDPPATLDGGDVLRAGPMLFVGLSSRTNEAGLAALARVAGDEKLVVVPLRVRGGLHLKSACTLASENLLLYDPAVLGADDVSTFRAAGLEAIPAGETLGANVLAIGPSVLVSAAAPRTADELSRRGLDVRVVDVGEMHKGDGALTCLSIRVPSVGAWCT